MNLKSRFVCVIDLDEVLINDIDIKKFNNFVKFDNKKYFATSAKSDPYYYDILCFEKNFKENNFANLPPTIKGLNFYYSRKKVYDLQISLTQQKSFEAISAFNGLCVYNYKNYINHSYNSKERLCDHLIINRKIYKSTNKKIFVNDKFKLFSPKEHRPFNNIVNFIISKTYTKVKNVFKI